MSPKSVPPSGAAQNIASALNVDVESEHVAATIVAIETQNARGVWASAGPVQRATDIATLEAIARGFDGVGGNVAARMGHYGIDLFSLGDPKAIADVARIVLSELEPMQRPSGRPKKWFRTAAIQEFAGIYFRATGRRAAPNSRPEGPWFRYLLAVKPLLVDPDWRVSDEALADAAYNAVGKTPG